MLEPTTPTGDAVRPPESPAGPAGRIPYPQPWEGRYGAHRLNSPARTTIDRLHQIPHLVTEIIATLGAPNPDGETARRTHIPASRPPLDLHIVDLLRTTDHRDESHSRVPIIRLAECSRIAWEALPDDQRATHPQPDQLAWETECQWLANAWPAALAHLHAVDIAWIENDIADIHAALCQAARLKPALPMRCTRLGCGNRAHLQPGNRWLVCEGGHTLDVEAERGRWLSMQDWTITETHSALKLYRGIDVPIGSLKGWAARGKLQPVDSHRPQRYNFGAVCRFLNDRERCA